MSKRPSLRRGGLGGRGRGKERGKESKTRKENRLIIYGKRHNLDSGSKQMLGGGNLYLSVHCALERKTRERFNVGKGNGKGWGRNGEDEKRTSDRTHPPSLPHSRSGVEDSEIKEENEGKGKEGKMNLKDTTES